MNLRELSDSLIKIIFNSKLENVFFNYNSDIAMKKALTKLNKDYSENNQA